MSLGPRNAKLIMRENLEQEVKNRAIKKNQRKNLLDEKKRQWETKKLKEVVEIPKEKKRPTGSTKVSTNKKVEKIEKIEKNETSLKP